MSSPRYTRAFSGSRSTLAAAVAAAASFGPAPASLAQGAGALEEVIVTAQRRETSLQDTPIAVTAFTQEKIQDMGLVDITDLGGFAPNTNIRKQPSSNSNASIYIRGVGSGETALTVDPKVSFYIDGVYMSKTVGSVFDLVDLQSIEVLRGPQGTLFGRNSTGGAVNVTTAKPSGELHVNLEATLGNDGYHRVKTSLDLPQVLDALSIKLSALDTKYDGWAKNWYPGDIPQASLIPNLNGNDGPNETKLASEDNRSFRAAVRLQPSESVTFDYAFDKTDNRGVPVPFQLSEVKTELYNGFTTTQAPFAIIGGELFQAMAKNVETEERLEAFVFDTVTDETLDVEGHSFTAAWAGDKATLKYIFGDRETNSGYGATDLDGGAYIARDAFYGGGQAVPVPGFRAAIPEGWIDMSSHELQLFGETADGWLSYTLGAYYYEEEVYQDNPQTFALPIVFIYGPALQGLSAGIAAATAAGPAGEALAQQLRGQLMVFQGAYMPFCQDVNDPNTCIGSQRLPIPGQGSPSGLNGVVDFIYGQESKSEAIYGQITFGMSESVNLTMGLRYTEDEREAFLYNENLMHTSIDDRLTNSDKWDNISYMATVDYAPLDNMSFYGTVSTGYNAGGFNARAASVTAWERQVDEESIISYELGMKGEWLGMVRANVALFYNDYTDIQTAQFEAGAGGASSVLVNAGEATYYGAELDLLVQPVDGLTIDLTYGYIDAEYDEYEGLNPDTNELVDISDRTIVARTPENTASLGIQYEYAFPFATISARVDGNYVDDMVFHPFQNQYDSAESRWLLNARLSLSNIRVGNTDGELRISLWGKNLQDEEYREWGIDFSSLGYAGNTYGRPRTYGIDFIYNYR